MNRRLASAVAVVANLAGIVLLVLRQNALASLFMAVGCGVLIGGFTIDSRRKVLARTDSERVLRAAKIAYAVGFVAIATLFGVLLSRYPDLHAPVQYAAMAAWTFGMPLTGSFFVLLKNEKASA